MKKRRPGPLASPSLERLEERAKNKKLGQDFLIELIGLSEKQFQRLYVRKELLS